VLAGGFVAGAGGAAASSEAAARCALKPLRFGAYACHYYGFISGVRTERWDVDYEGVIFEPQRRCPHESQHARGGVDVSYHTQSVSHRRRARVVVLWERSAERALAPSSIGTPRFIPFTVSVRRFASGTEPYRVPPPPPCAEAPKQLDMSGCGERTRSVGGTVESHFVNRRTAGANVLVPTDLIDLHDCPDVANWALGAAGHATFARDVVLRKPKFTLRGHVRQTVPVRKYGKVVGKIVLTGSWTATFCQTGKVKPNDCGKQLVARATSAGARRGGTVVLDGSRSEGDIVSYRWRVSRGRDCPSGTKLDQATELTGARVSFRALCSFRATLTVRDRDSSDSTSIAVPVRARPWKTTFAHVAEGRLNSLLVDGHLVLGRNVCAHEGLEGEQRSGHILHRGGANGPNDGFTLGSIASGPFRGNWYVSKYTAEVRRASLISQDLYPGTDLYSTNGAAGRLQDFQALFNSVRDHERLHSELIKEALGRNDGAKRVEAMVAPDRDELATQVNAALVRFEEALAAATAEPRVKARMRARWSRSATVFVRAGGGAGFVSRTFPSLAELGDESP
jgi:hypothetical protein